MIRVLPGEEWKEIAIEGKLKFHYAVSNYGRIISYSDNFSDGTILRGGLIGGYPTLPVRPDGKTKTFYVHKLVGDYFVPKESEHHNHLIHLDYNKENNITSNLKWVERKEMIDHQKKNPAVIEGRERKMQIKTQVGHKLTSTDVIRLKKKIFDPKRKTRLKMIAREFGISEMQLYRIKSGENWGHIRVENEPPRSVK